MNVVDLRALRVLLWLLAVGLAAPLPSLAQQPAKIPRIGYLSPGTPGGGPPELVIQRLQSLGYVDGKSVIIERRYAGGKTERLPELAAELVGLKVDLIFTPTNAGAFAAKNATRTIPIVVFAAHGALGTGLVTSLARPGGNLTGVESLAPEIDAKRVQLLKEIVPGLAQIAVLYDAEDQASPLHLKSTQAAGRVLNVAISTLEVRRPSDYDTVFSSVAAKPPQGLLMFTSTLTFNNWKRTADYAQQHRVPTVCEFKELVAAGCLTSYGATFAEFAERNAAQIDKILKGAKPGDLPFEQMTRFELAVNLKTAKALGITIPASVLVRADHVLE